MALIKCTKKLLTEMGISPVKPVDPAPGLLGPWCANLLRINRRKHLLIVNELTLYALVVPDVSRARIRRLDEEFRGALSAALVAEGYPPGVRSGLLCEYDQIEYASTDNRSVLGTMNEYALMYRTELEMEGEPAPRDISSCIVQLNTIPLGARAGCCATDLLFDACASRDPGAPEPEADPGNRSGARIIAWPDPAVPALFERIRDYYEEQIDWQPGIRRAWVESWLRSLLDQGMPAEKLEKNWEDLFTFVSYFDTSGQHTPAAFPWWEYSLMLEWVDSHFMEPGRYDLNLANARRILECIRLFLVFLVARGQITGTGGIEEAITWICGGRRLRLVQVIPFTGKEFWTSVHDPKHGEAAFNMAEYWLVLLYLDKGKSWDGVRQALLEGSAVQEKLVLLEGMLQKLERIGYRDPLQLVYNDIYKHEIEAAWRWVRGEPPRVR